MDGIIRIVRDFFFVILAASIGSIVLSIILMLAVTSIYQSPLVTFLVTLLFTPFHFSDLRRFFREREFLLVATRFIFMTAISAFLVGLFRFALEYATVDWFLLPLLLVTVPILFALFATYLFFAFFFPKNSTYIRLNHWWNDLVRGGKIYGIWWDY
ncbi:MAG: hypothetical protein ABL952_00060 [Pyrinomonadaceae bacterium]